MGWTTPKDWAGGEILTAANMNTHVRDNLKFLFGGVTADVQPYLMLSNTTAQTFTDDVEVNLQFDTVVEDNCSAYDTGGHRYFAPNDGVYLATLTIGDPVAATVLRRISVGYGPSSETDFQRTLLIYTPSDIANVENAVMTAAISVRLDSGDRIAPRASIDASGSVSPASLFSLTWLHP